MPERLAWQKMRASERSRTVALEPEETLVHDVRANLTPTRMVENKLMALLKSSDPSTLAGSSEFLRDVKEKHTAPFRMIDALQEGKQRAAAGRRIDDLAAGRNAALFTRRGSIDVRVRPVATPLP